MHMPEEEIDLLIRALQNEARPDVRAGIELAVTDLLIDCDYEPTLARFALAAYDTVRRLMELCDNKPKLCRAALEEMIRFHERATDD